MRRLCRCGWIRCFPTFLFIFFVISILKPRKYALVDYAYLSADEVLFELSLKLNTNDSGVVDTRPFCPPILGARDRIEEEINHNYSSWLNDDFDFEQRNIAAYWDLLPGGIWEPKSCNPVHHVSIIIPYRGRPDQLKHFLLYMHPFLQLQLLRYRIMVVEQVDDLPFNRGKLFNIGFTEALKQGWSHCFIFHDVDLLPESIANIYGCTQRPRHMSAVVDSFRYTLQYQNLCGGVVSLLSETFQFVNGFSNSYFGWGGEDDDFMNRLRAKDLQVVRLSPDVSSYQMLPHAKELPNKDRYKTLDQSSKHHDHDGLNSLQYTVINHIINPLYSVIQVKL